MIKAVLLVGGSSRRMGYDKAAMAIHGKSQTEHLAELCRNAGLDLYLSCRPDQVRTYQHDYKLLVDRTPDIGPIQGVQLAFEEDPQASWLVLAVDLIELTQEAILDLIGQPEGDWDILTYKKETIPFPETTLTIYRPTVSNLINRSIEYKQYSLQSILKRVRTETITPKDPAVLKNANRPEDLN